jgi:hypothetical protein
VLEHLRILHVETLNRQEERMLRVRYHLFAPLPRCGGVVINTNPAT